MTAGTYDSDLGLSLSMAGLSDLMVKAGARKLYIKHLAKNDNSKNQLYFGPDLESLNIIPSGETTSEPSRSSKPREYGGKIFKSSISLDWLAPSGQMFAAPESQIIHYPQYPETRFSGFLKGSQVQLSEWMNPDKQGRNPNRFLVLGIGDSQNVLAYLAVDGSLICRELEELETLAPKVGVFFEIALQMAIDGRKRLLEKLKEIYELGWIDAVRLTSSGFVPCNSPHCGGYTLEAYLGIRPNGFAEPDFLGWEVKQFGVRDFSKLESSIVTLMTPEPDGGIYCSEGVGKFLRTYGYQDLRGRADRINFGGIHRFGQKVIRTGLALYLMGFDTHTQKILDTDGGIVLLDDLGGIAAKWSFAKLINHWKKKHNQAVYVPSMSQIDASRRYRYGSTIKLCSGTDLIHALGALQNLSLYYDPGIKLENASTKPEIKRRNQFRIKSKNIDDLYNNVEIIDLRSPI